MDRLDSMVVSVLQRPERHAPVTQWWLVQPPEELYISVITLGAIVYGAARQRRKQPEFAELLEGCLKSVATSFHDRVLPFDEAAARRWAELGYTNSDLRIAAIAIESGLTVAIRHVRDFMLTGGAVLNPFEEADD